MSGQKTKEKNYNADYVIGLIDSENYLPMKNGDYPKRYGIHENANGLEYLEKAKEGDLVLGYKTIMYREFGGGREWKDLPRFRCKYNGIFAVFSVESGFKRCKDKDWLNYPNTIILSKPLFFLEDRILFKDLKKLIPKSEYVNDYRRSVTRFSNPEAKKIFEMMRNMNLNNPEITEKVNKILTEFS